MFFLPRKRKELLEQTVGDETVLYDEAVHKAFCLNAAASAIWHQCDGASTLNQATHAATRATGAPVAAETALLMLGSLEQQGLLEPSDTATPGFSPVADLSRRRMMAGAATLLLPAVFAVMAPRAAEAYSCTLGLNGRCILTAVQPVGTAGETQTTQQPQLVRRSRFSD